jgi:hypothetical protein
MKPTRVIAELLPVDVVMTGTSASKHQERSGVNRLRFQALERRPGEGGMMANADAHPTSTGAPRRSASRA